MCKKLFTKLLIITVYTVKYASVNCILLKHFIDLFALTYIIFFSTEEYFCNQDFLVRSEAIACGADLSFSPDVLLILFLTVI